MTGRWQDSWTFRIVDQDSGASVSAVPVHGAGHLLRFARIGVLRQDADVTETAAADRARFVAPADDPGVIRYGVVFEIEQVWQSLGSRAGDLLYSVSLGPGEEVKVAVQDGRWRKKPDARERPLQIVAKMVAARLVGDGLDVTPLEPFVVPDLAGAAMDTVRFLDHRTVRATEALRHRPLGVTPLEIGRASCRERV